MGLDHVSRARAQVDVASVCTPSALRFGLLTDCACCRESFVMVIFPIGLPRPGISSSGTKNAPNLVADPVDSVLDYSHI